MRNTLYKNNSGQALLFVVVALAISMVVGVSISTRTLSLSRRVSNTDTHSRVYYSAEAGIERFVNLPMDELEAIASGINCVEDATDSVQNDDGSCTFNLGEDIETSTQITVESITTNEEEPAPHYAVELKNGSVAGINLYNASATRLRVCWKSKASDPVAIYYSLWYLNGVRAKGILIPDPAAQPMPAITGGTPGGSYSPYQAYYDYCFSPLDIQASGKVSLNVMALGSSTKVGIFPLNNSLPSQGYRIISKARLKSDETNQVQVTKVIEVVRSYDYVPGFFDNAIYAQGRIAQDGD